MFPIINHIDDIWNEVSAKSGFIRVDKDGITSILYRTIGDKNQFNTPLSREARGIKFKEESGEILARPFHKFFNKGEFPEQESLLYTHPFSIWDKLDGSMIHPILIDNTLRLCTKSGITSIAQEAEYLLTPDLIPKLKDLLLNGLTPIFEYTSPTNRVVINYSSPQLTLLAIRETISGIYCQDLSYFSHYLKVPIPHQYPHIDINSLDSIRDWKDKEGVVLVFSNGYRLKIKTLDYLHLHNFTDIVRTEKDVISLIFNDKYDDILPMFDVMGMTEDRRKLEEYKSKLFISLDNVHQKLISLINKYQEHDRKYIAMSLTNMVNRRELYPLEVSIFWNIYDGKKDFYSCVKEAILNVKSSKIHELYWLIGTSY